VNFSVIITSFNSQKTITQAIQSAKSLIPKPFEIIVIDDASVDNTLMKIKDELKDFEGGHIISNKENMGQSFNRNCGVKTSKSDYIIFMDDDDISLPQRAGLHLSAFASGADISYVSSVKIYENGYSRKYINEEFRSRSQSKIDLIRQVLVGSGIKKNLYSPSSTLAVKKHIFLGINGFDVSMRRLEDIDIYIRMIENDCIVHWTKDIGVHRFFSYNVNKSNLKNQEAEKVLVHRYKKYLSNRQYYIANKSMHIRMCYFDRNIFGLLKLLPALIIIFIFAPQKLFSLINRLVHDFHQR